MAARRLLPWILGLSLALIAEPAFAGRGNQSARSSNRASTSRSRTSRQNTSPPQINPFGRINQLLRGRGEQQPQAMVNAANAYARAGVDRQIIRRALGVAPNLNSHRSPPREE